jgi:hypothetical protein
VAMAHGVDNVEIPLGGVRLGCVVRVESTRQYSTTSHWTSLARGMRPGHFLREVPMAGTCERRISPGGDSPWGKSPGWRCC